MACDRVGPYSRLGTSSRCQVVLRVPKAQCASGGIALNLDSLQAETYGMRQSWGLLKICHV